MSDPASGNNGSGILSVAYLRALGQAAQVVGVPALVLFLLITQLEPRIDHGIAIADRVDAELQVVIERGCGPLPLPPPAAHAS